MTPTRKAPLPPLPPDVVEAWRIIEGLEREITFGAARFYNLCETVNSASITSDRYA